MNVDALPVFAASLTLVVVSLAIARWYRLGIEREVAISAVRAVVQLLAVGLLFMTIFESSHEVVWACIWVAAMVLVASAVVVRRATLRIRRVAVVGFVALVFSTAMTLAVTFGFSVLEFGAVELVVIAGITIGNAVPSAVLGVNQAVELSRDRVGEIEAVLSMGFGRRDVVRFMAPRAARAAIIPQVERTKVVGLIALPGAMTGLLLAGVDPIDAVALQLLVMFLVLGTAVLCVVALVVTIVGQSVTDQLRVADWVHRSYN